MRNEKLGKKYHYINININKHYHYKNGDEQLIFKRGESRCLT